MTGWGVSCPQQTFRFPVSPCSFFFQTANRQPLTANICLVVGTWSPSRPPLAPVPPRTARGAVPTWSRKAAAGRPRVGAWLRRALRCWGHDKSCPYLGSPCGERPSLPGPAPDPVVSPTSPASQSSGLPLLVCLPNRQPL